MTTTKGFFGPMNISLSTRTREEQLVAERDALRRELEQIKEGPQILSAVLEIYDDQVLIATGTAVVTVPKPAKMDGLAVGAVVRVSAKNPVILAVVASPIALGAVLSVRAVLDEKTAEIEVGGQKRAVLIGVQDGVKAGDRILLDPTGNTIVRNLGPGDQARAFTGETGVSWEEIGGLEDVKRELREAIEEPVREAALYKRYGRKPVRGVLLYGPPGCGKTMLGKAAATALADVHGATARATGFQYVKGPELLNKFVGASEENIRAVFAGARAHRDRHGYPAIVFIDEADALMGKRGAAMWDGMERTIVPQFLAEMDGLEDAGAMVLLATNRPDSLDPAIVRDGRIDRKIHVRRPTQIEAFSIFERALRDRPCAPGATATSLSNKSVQELFDDRRAIAMIRRKSGSDIRFALRDLVSGAMIASLVERATALAMRRELAGEVPAGISPDDLKATVDAVLEENRKVDHAAAIADVAGDVANVSKVSLITEGSR